MHARYNLGLDLSSPRESTVTLNVPPHDCDPYPRPQLPPEDQPPSQPLLGPGDKLRHYNNVSVSLLMGIGY